jgi:hypothetical protein
MKKIILVIFFAGLSIVSFAQKAPLATPYAVPLDTVTKKITYDGVVEVKNASAEELYKRFNDWFHSYYKNPTEVIRENDSIKFMMVGKPRFRITDLKPNDAGKTDGGIVQYTITVAAKNGRFRYELTDFNWKQTSYYACEQWLNVSAPNYSPLYNDYLQQLDKTALEVVQALKNAVMVEKAVKDKDNW